MITTSNQANLEIHIELLQQDRQKPGRSGAAWLRGSVKQSQPSKQAICSSSLPYLPSISVRIKSRVLLKFRR